MRGIDEAARVNGYTVHSAYVTQACVYALIDTQRVSAAEIVASLKDVYMTFKLAPRPTTMQPPSVRLSAPSTFLKRSELQDFERRL